MSKKPFPPGKLVKHLDTGSIARTLPEVVNPVKCTIVYGNDAEGRPVNDIKEVKQWGPSRHLVDPMKLEHIGFID